MFQNKYRFHGIHLLTICEPSTDTFQPIFSGCVGLFIECVSSQGCYISLHWRLELRENDFLCARRAKSQEEGKRNTFFFWKLVELSQKREWKIFLHIPHFVLLLCFFYSDGVKKEHSEELTSWAVKKKKSDPEFHLLCNDKLNSRRRNGRWWARVECFFF